MIIKNIFSLTASIISVFIFILFFNTNSNSDENNIKYYSNDEGILSIMYHRFNESKYPSTNIQMDIFKKHIDIIKKLNIDLILRPQNLDFVTYYKLTKEYENLA